MNMQVVVMRCGSNVIDLGLKDSA